MMTHDCDDDHRPTPAAALAALPALFAESDRLAESADRLAGRLRLQQHKLAVAVAAIAGQPLPGKDGPPSFSLEVRLADEKFAECEMLFETMQQKWPGMTIDDCVADIFEAGMRILAMKLPKAA